MSNRVVRRFCFTLNDYTEDDYDKIKTFLVEHCKYGIVGREIAPTTNRPHLQGFGNLKRNMRFNALKARLHNSIHIEQANGTDEQNQKYCSKAGSYFETGTPSQQGQRNDLQACISAIQSGTDTCAKVALKFPSVYIRYHRGIEKYLQILKPIQPRNFETKVFYYWGPPGVGKSRRALAEAQEIDKNSIYYKNRGLWWDGYEQQKCVIIDDFYGWIKYDEMLKIMDRYPYRVQYKGGSTEFTSTHIWITSNINTDLLYKFQDYNPAAFNRRLYCKINMLS